MPPFVIRSFICCTILNVVFNFQKLPGFGDVVTQVYLNLLNFQNLGFDNPPLHSWSLFVPGSNFVGRLNGKVAQEERKNGRVGYGPVANNSIFAPFLRRSALFRLCCLEVDIKTSLHR